MSFCQDTRTVKTETLRKIKRDLDKCDSLKVAYDLKSATLDTLVLSSLKMFEDINKEREERFELQRTLDQKTKDYTGLLKKSKRRWIVPVLIGIAGGTILGASL